MVDNRFLCFLRHSGIEPTNDYHKHNTHTRTSPRQYRASKGNPLIRRCPGPAYAEPRAQPQSLTELGGSPVYDWTNPRTGYSSCPQIDSPWDRTRVDWDTIHSPPRMLPPLGRTTELDMICKMSLVFAHGGIRTRVGAMHSPSSNHSTTSTLDSFLSIRLSISFIFVTNNDSKEVQYKIITQVIFN